MHRWPRFALFNKQRARGLVCCIVLMDRIEVGTIWVSDFSGNASVLNAIRWQDAGIAYGSITLCLPKTRSALEGYRFGPGINPGERRHCLRFEMVHRILLRHSISRGQKQADCHPLRCQLITVSGLAITQTERQPNQTLESQTQNKRAARFN